MKNLRKKIMEFLFGKKYPIFDTEGDIQHKRKESFQEWKEYYEKSPEKNWRNHSGLFFLTEQNKKKKT